MLKKITYFCVRRSFDIQPQESSVRIIHIFCVAVNIPLDKRSPFIAVFQCQSFGLRHVSPWLNVAQPGFVHNPESIVERPELKTDPEDPRNRRFHVMRKHFARYFRLKSRLLVLLGKVGVRNLVGGRVLEQTAATVVHVLDHRSQRAQLILIRADSILHVEQLLAHDQNESF